MIICFGSLNADLVYRVDAMPQDGQTIAAQAFSLQAGGKGANQAAAAALDSANVVMVGAVGNDPMAETALQNLKKLGADLDGVTQTETPTGNAAVIVDNKGHNRIIVSSGANAYAAESGISDDVLKSASSVLIQLETPVQEAETLLLRCKALGTRSILNLAPAKPMRRDALAAAGILVVNEDEAESLSTRLGCAASASGLSTVLGCDVIRTLGRDGAEAVCGSEHFEVPAIPVDTVDTTAAGDCFIGVLAAGLDRGLALRPAMERASAAAAVCCTRSGSQSSLPSASEIDRFIASPKHI